MLRIKLSTLLAEAILSLIGFLCMIGLLSLAGLLA
jgi:hypothetical protein